MKMDLCFIFLVLGYLDVVRLIWDLVIDIIVGLDFVNCLFFFELFIFLVLVGVIELLFFFFFKVVCDNFVCCVMVCF